MTLGRPAASLFLSYACNPRLKSVKNIGPLLKNVDDPLGLIPSWNGVLLVGPFFFKCSEIIKETRAHSSEQTLVYGRRYFSVLIPGVKEDVPISTLKFFT